jgi:hypothetical protein
VASRPAAPRNGQGQRDALAVFRQRCSASHLGQTGTSSSAHVASNLGWSVRRGAHARQALHQRSWLHELRLLRRGAMRRRAPHALGWAFSRRGSRTATRPSMSTPSSRRQPASSCCAWSASGTRRRRSTTATSRRFRPRTSPSRNWPRSILSAGSSSCHLDHVDTSVPDALRTHIYASLLAATILTTACHAAAAVHQIPLHAISPLTAGIAAPLLAVPLLLLWLDRPLTPEALSDCILRVLALGCRDQNPRCTRRNWGVLCSH